MTLPVIVRPEAKGDIREARAWYHEISPEFANAFMGRLDQAIALAQEHPLAFPALHRKFRRVLLRRFPYAVFYQVGDQRIVIVAVLHQARGPEILATR
jgi:toxin ParE1/3/4